MYKQTYYISFTTTISIQAANMLGGFSLNNISLLLYASLI